jgi:hypothetical protein
MQLNKNVRTEGSLVNREQSDKRSLKWADPSKSPKVKCWNDCFEVLFKLVPLPLVPVLTRSSVLIPYCCEKAPDGAFFICLDSIGHAGCAA